MEMNSKDLIIIGGGPAGLRAAELAARHNLDYVILEKGVVGQAWKDIRPDMPLLSPCHPQRDWTSLSKRFPIWKLDVNRPYCNALEFTGYLDRFADHFNLNIQENTTVQSISKSNGSFEVRTPSVTLNSRAIIMATGFFGSPFIPDIPGVENNPIVSHSHFYRSPEQYKNQRVIILGGGNSAAEIAIALSGFSQVFLVTRGKLKYFSKTNNLCHIRGISESLLKELIRMEIIRYYPDEKINRVEGEKVFLKHREIETQNIIFATGYRPLVLPVENQKAIQIRKFGFPQVTAEGESRQIKNLFFAGPLAKTRFSSIFIHGFVKAIPQTIENIADRLNIG